MSDGPYRSLPMDRNWKRVARFAENEASDVADIFNVLITALTGEATLSNLPAFIKKAQKILATASLFGDNQFDTLRRDSSGQPMVNSFLDNLEVSNMDQSSKKSIVNAITTMLVTRSDRAIRQIREHYLRKTSQVNTERVINRIVHAIKNEGFNDLANRLMQNDHKQFPIKKRNTGVDDGVSL